MSSSLLDSFFNLGDNRGHMFWLNALVNQRGHDCQCFLADSAFEEVADGEKLIEGIAQIVVAVSARTR